MMSPEHRQALLILIALIGVMFIAIIGTLVASRRKSLKKPPASEAELGQLAREEKIPLPGATPSPEKVPVTPTPVAAKPAAPATPEPEVDLKYALRNTQASFFGRIKSLFQSSPNPLVEDIEEILYTSDIGSKTVQDLLAGIEELPSSKKTNIQDVQGVLRDKMVAIFEQAPDGVFKQAPSGPTVIMIVGVNGAGKTTSIGKISAQYAGTGKKVLVAAGDTFRAAAEAQLKVWTERAQVDIFSPAGVTDPGAVAHDAVAKAIAQNFDLVLIDTAGRLHTQGNLMEELKKVKRVIQKQSPEAPHEVIIVLDANSGQNALVQAKEFHKAVGLTGAILTKMDGTAKGGVALGLADELKIPIKFIGVGERVQDLRPFSSKEYIDSILG